ncbi:hypothetical protein Syun_020905 [Stephania yunnanensis]|uniref:Uncharacterized protein n=1 Tax=Stephania yunnanensis TaxID=152371 RepID=A0AAP0IFI7_9MAGN
MNVLCDGWWFVEADVVEGLGGRLGGYSGGSELSGGYGGFGGSGLEPTVIPRPEFFNGQNAIVAVNVYLGYNLEGSLVMLLWLLSITAVPTDISQQFLSQFCLAAGVALAVCSHYLFVSLLPRYKELLSPPKSDIASYPGSPTQPSRSSFSTSQNCLLLPPPLRSLTNLPASRRLSPRKPNYASHRRASYPPTTAPPTAAPPTVASYQSRPPPPPPTTSGCLQPVPPPPTNCASHRRLPPVAALSLVARFPYPRVTSLVFLLEMCCKKIRKPNGANRSWFGCDFKGSRFGGGLQSGQTANPRLGGGLVVFTTKLRFVHPYNMDIHSLAALDTPQ